MTDHLIIPADHSTIKALLWTLIAVIVVCSALVCVWIDSTPKSIVQNYTNLYAQQADVWIVDGVRWRTVVEGKSFELKDMP